jgi:hypothetical protein
MHYLFSHIQWYSRLKNYNSNNIDHFRSLNLNLIFVLLDNQIIID